MCALATATTSPCDTRPNTTTLRACPSQVQVRIFPASLAPRASLSAPAAKGPHAPRATGPFQAFSVDATGQRDVSRYGNKYAHSFRDLYSNRQATICTPSLSGHDTQVAIQRWLALWLPAGTPTRGITYHADAAYLHGSARAYMDVLEMVPHGAAPHEHATHPVERGVGLLGETITTILADARLPPSFWEDAAAHHDHIWNRLSPTAGGSPPLLPQPQG